VLGQQLPGELENIYARIEEELRSQYVLGFTSSNRAKDGSYRKLRIEVDHPGAVITARPGYYAPSPNRAPVKH
jgi:VWFA-related protein